MTTDKKKLNVLCLVDRNETMKPRQTEVLEVFEHFLKSIQDTPDTETKISVVLFGENVEWLCRAMPAEYAKPLTNFTYTPIANAALNDSLVKSLNQFQDILIQDGSDNEETLVCVLTNGAENYSKVSTTEDVKKLIAKLEEKGWGFLFPMKHPTDDQHSVPITKTMWEVGAVLDIVCILDRSGSMSGMQSDVIGGYNQFIDKLKEERPAKVTLVQFDTQYEVVYKDKPIKEVPELTSAVYFARGGTALYDAIGQALGEKKPQEHEKVDRVILIVTDGEENSSHEIRYDQVKALIAEQEDHGAKVVYLAANIQQHDIVTHQQIAKSISVGGYVGAPGTVQAMPNVVPQIYACSYSCPVPNIQTFQQPNYNNLQPLVATNVACSITGVGQTASKLFDACLQTCAGYPVSITTSSKTSSNQA